MTDAHIVDGEPELRIYTEPNRRRTIATNRLPATPLANPRRTRARSEPTEPTDGTDPARVIVLP